MEGVFLIEQNGYLCGSMLTYTYKSIHTDK